MAETQQTFNFELVSPDRVLVSEPAWQVTIPGEEGYFGVRAGHMSLIAAVRAGVVEVFKREGDAPEKIFISGGFADVTAANCTLLAEQAVNVNELDAAAIDREIEDLNGKIAATADTVEKSQLYKKLQLASAKRAAVSTTDKH
jgi:F-type H+-transporting ATPase subunit epsilon